MTYVFGLCLASSVSVVLMSLLFSFIVLSSLDDLDRTCASIYAGNTVEQTFSSFLLTVSQVSTYLSRVLPSGKNRVMLGLPLVRILRISTR